MKSETKGVYTLSPKGIATNDSIADTLIRLERKIDRLLAALDVDEDE